MGARDCIRTDLESARPSRYIHIEPIGRRGTVSRAYDPKLLREIALETVPLPDPSAQERALAEVRAMAQLSHPNIVPIYDVEICADAVVLASEFVAGTDLETWLSEARSWRQIVGMFIAAGRGLAAAHAAGVSHLDFTPRNVLVGIDGRARVTGFGLSRLRSEPQPIEVAQTQGPGRDQYDFCVALWEGLTGTRPFAARTARALTLGSGRDPLPWPRGVAAPKSVASALRRGLCDDPTARWPSMAALLDRLDIILSRTRPVVPAAAGVGALVVMTGMALAARADDLRDLCTGAAAQLSAAWGESRREAVQRAMLATELAYAPDAWTHAAAKLDAYASSWAASHADACAATNVRREQSAAAMDLRMRCLHRAKVDLQAATDLLAHADDQVVQQSHQVVGSLPSLDRCADLDALQAEVAPPEPFEADAVEAIRVEIAESSALYRAGKYSAALERMQRIAARAESISYVPLQLEVLFALGPALDSSVDEPGAERAYRSALRLALASEQLGAAHRAAAALVNLLGETPARTPETLAYASVARALGEYATAHDEAMLRNAMGNMLDAAGRPSEAISYYREAITWCERAFGAEDPRTAMTRMNLGMTLSLVGEHEAAESELRAAVTAVEAAVGSDHPYVAMARTSFGMVLASVGRHDEARTELETALALVERVLGPEHPWIGLCREGLGQVALTTGRHADAERELRLAVAVSERALGANHPQTVSSRQRLEQALIAQR